METVIVFMLVMLIAAVAVTAVVAVGMKGRGSARAPGIASFLARTARHLNGDAKAPKRVAHLFR